MATKTRTEFVTRALQKLLVVGSGQSANAEDSTLVDGMVDSVLEDLAERGVYLVDDSEAIALAPFEYLADCLAQAAAPDFGRARDIKVTEYVEQKLRQISAVAPSYQTMQAEYF